MDRRFLLAVSLCFLIYIGWQKYFIEPYLPKTAVSATASGTVMGQAATAGSTATASSAATSVNSTGQGVAGTAPETKTLIAKDGQITLSNESRLLAGWDLTSYHWGASGMNVPLKAVGHDDSELEIAFEDPAFAYLSSVRGKFEEIPGGWKTIYEDNKVRLVREFKASPDRPEGELTLRATFLGEKTPKFAFVSLESSTSKQDPDLRDRQFVYWSEGKIHRVRMSETVEQQQLVGPIHWMGTTNRYFVFAIAQSEPKDADTAGLIQPLGPWAGRMSMVYPFTAGSKEVTIPLKVYFGPKSLSILRGIDPTLDAVVDYGVFKVLAYPLLWLLKFIHGGIGNWGLDIILLTLFIRILVIPLNWKGMRNMKKMAKYQPLMKEMQEKYKDDRQKYQQETMVFMKTHGLNPLAGCLPILVQMPVFFAFYQMLYSSIELYQAPFGLWIHDLSLKDPFYISPVIMAGLMYLQQRLTPSTATDPMQAKMLQFMPLIFGVFMVSVPAGLVLYMLVSTTFGILQQLAFNRLLKNAV